MLYLPKSHQCFIKVPKTGTSSLSTAIRDNFEDYDKQFERWGHVTVTESQQILSDLGLDKSPLFLAVVRDPIPRLASQINHYWYKKPPVTLDYAIEFYLDIEPNQVLMRTQADYLNNPHVNLKTWKFENLRTLATYLEIKELPNLNVAVRNTDSYFTEDQIKSHRRFNEILQRLEKDYILYNDAM